MDNCESELRELADTLSRHRAIADLQGGDDGFENVCTPLLPGERLECYGCRANEFASGLIVGGCMMGGLLAAVWAIVRWML